MAAGGGLELQGHRVGGLGGVGVLGLVEEDFPAAEEGVVGVEGPQGAEGPVAQLGRGVGHQGLEAVVRGGLVAGGQGGQGLGAEGGAVGGGGGQDVDARGVVEVGQGLGGEEPHGRVGALQAGLQRRDGHAAQALQAQGGVAGGGRVEQGPGPLGHPLGDQLVVGQDRQAADDLEVAALVLVVDGGDGQLDDLVGLGRGHLGLADAVVLLEAAVDGGLDQGRGLEALAVALDDDREGDVLQDVGRAQHAPPPQRVGPGAGLDQHGAQGDGHRAALHRALLGLADVVQLDAQQPAAGEAGGGVAGGDLDLDVEAVGLGDAGGQLGADLDHRRGLGGEPALGVDVVGGLLHQVDELLAVGRGLGVGPGAVQADHEADALDGDLAGADHVGQLAEGLLDLRRRPGLLLGGVGTQAQADGDGQCRGESLSEHRACLPARPPGPPRAGPRRR